MRKFSIPIIMYVISIAMLLTLSIGQTYAYFSAIKTASGSVGMADVSMVWRDGNTMSPLDTIFDDVNSIVVSSNLKRSEYTQIQGLQNSTIQNITLLIQSTSSIDVYCRVKLTATYISDGETKDCSEYILLAYNGSEITSTGSWKLEDGYYYYKGTNLTAISSGSAVRLANQFYLSPNSDADIFGKQISIQLTAQMVQASNNAEQFEWA